MVMVLGRRRFLVFGKYLHLLFTLFLNQYHGIELFSYIECYNVIKFLRAKYKSEAEMFSHRRFDFVHIRSI